MRSFRNLFITVVVAAILGVGAFCLHRRLLGGEPGEAKKSPMFAAVGSAGSAKPPAVAVEPAPGAAAPEAAATAPASGKNATPGGSLPAKPQVSASTSRKGAGGKPEKETDRMHDIPVSAEHPAKGLKIPYFDNEGKLQMTFVIGVATRLDADHIDMSDMQVETFDEQQQHEMYIDLPKSILNLNTSVISTEKHVTIRREDFTLTGETMEFNTKTKQGSLGGSVKMLIYNLDNPMKPASETPAPPESAASTAPKTASESKAP